MTPRVRLPASAFAHSPPFLLALEQAIWSELVMCMHLTQRLTTHGVSETQPPPSSTRAAGSSEGEGEGEGEGGGVSLPEQLLALLPPPPRQGWPACMPDAPSSAEWLRRWGYPSLRRAQRLSFVLPTLVADLDRQALLQVSSTRERLQKCVLHLSGMRRRLAALAALAGPARARGHSDDA